MSKTHRDQRQHRRKAWKSGQGVKEHAKRAKRRKPRALQPAAGFGMLEKGGVAA